MDGNNSLRCNKAVEIFDNDTTICNTVGMTVFRDPSEEKMVETFLEEEEVEENKRSRILSIVKGMVVWALKLGVGFVKKQSITMLELQAIDHGLKGVIRDGCKRIIMGFEPTTVISYITQQCEPTWEARGITNSILYSISQLEYSYIHHIFMDANNVADHLTSLLTILELSMLELWKWDSSPFSCPNFVVSSYYKVGQFTPEVYEEQFGYRKLCSLAPFGYYLHPEISYRDSSGEGILDSVISLGWADYFNYV
ncbi:hypothetical protein GIB67_001770 [Kingdonia uniflora]|uniref:RNase H type-1 domain-containing protein n=1 Tax=Kingdonia uniflora TaxID=39325 RepID=A0A7J7LBW6_9MAGN|nr:hypothetical protein GIB67_001770 [Kingdonia uniflora]